MDIFPNIPALVLPSDSYKPTPQLRDVLKAIGYPLDKEVLESFREVLPQLAVALADFRFEVHPRWYYANSQQLMQMMDKTTLAYTLERLYQYEEKDNFQNNTLDNFQYKTHAMSECTGFEDENK